MVMIRCGEQVLEEVIHELSLKHFKHDAGFGAVLFKDGVIIRGTISKEDFEKIKVVNGVQWVRRDSMMDFM